VSVSPRFSAVVPTRDRPDLLDFCLQGLAAQDAAYLEVVVSDNATTAPAREVFDRYARPGWHYVRTAEPVPMHDNFERAVAEASGDYVAVVIDKTILHPSAIGIAAGALAAQPADIVTWRNEGYHPVDEMRDLGAGRFRPSSATTAPALYDPATELAARFSNSTRRGLDPVHYVRGKIVFGAFSRALLERIRARTGRIFHPLAPDYTSMVPACVLADRGLDVGRPLLLSYNSLRSNGRRQGVNPEHARRFIESVDPAIVDALPIPGLYAAVHNVVAYDLVSAAARLPAGSTPALDMPNLVRRAREDLAGVVWTDSSERDEQQALLCAAEERHGVGLEAAPAAASRGTRATMTRLLARVPPLERIAVRATGGSPPATFASPLDAARAADRHYTRRGVSP
jgi:glycosyltransferase involved in cell wall biosynthesis